MNHPGGLRCLGASPHRPASNLIIPHSEKVNKLQGSESRSDNSVDHGCSFQVLEMCSLCLSIHVKERRLELHRIRNDGPSSMFKNPLLNLWKPSIFLAYVIVCGQIDKINDGLGSQEKLAVQNLDLLVAPVIVFHHLVVIEKL